jgi:hypothetical protein
MHGASPEAGEAGPPPPYDKDMNRLPQIDAVAQLIGRPGTLWPLTTERRASPRRSQPSRR